MENIIFRNNDLQTPHGGSISDIYQKLAQEYANEIDEELIKLGITIDNAKDYHIDIQKYGYKTTYKVYKKEFIGEFFSLMEVNINQ